jgi:hypothetical protein
MKNISYASMTCRNPRKNFIGGDDDGGDDFEDDDEVG